MSSDPGDKVLSDEKIITEWFFPHDLWNVIQNLGLILSLCIFKVAGC